MPPLRIEDLLDHPVPDLALPDSAGGTLRLREGVGRHALVLFFYLMNGTPTWVRELREFREHHAAFERTGTVVAGISPNTVAEQRAQAERLALPYRLASDADRAVARGLGALRVLGIGSWTVELYRRATVLIDRDGIVAAVWSRVRIKDHARKVLAAIDALDRPA